MEPICSKCEIKDGPICGRFAMEVCKRSTDAGPDMEVLLVGYYYLSNRLKAPENERSDLYYCNCEKGNIMPLAESDH